MKFLTYIVGLVFVHSAVHFSSAQGFEALEIVPRNIKSFPLDSKNLKFISDRLYLDKLADNLDCEVRVSQTKKENFQPVLKL